MTQENNVIKEPLHPTPVGKRIWQGAGIAFILICIFLLGAGESNPFWPKYWMVRPLIIVPVAGAMGGVFYYFMDHLRYRDDWKRKALANIISLVAYIIALWLGTVLGLDGTLWD